MFGKPGTFANADSVIEFTAKKKMGMNSDGISAIAGRQICLILRIDR
jgi:hypothetical protein